MSQESAAVEAVLSAHERTLRRGSARIVLSFQVAVLTRMFLFGMRVVFLLRRSSKTVYSPKMLEEPRPGIIDLEAHRCVYDGDRPKAELIVGDRSWHGAPGTTVDGLSAQPASAYQPLWLVDVVGGVVDATEQAPEAVNGRTVRRFSAHADLNRAAEMVPYTMAMPPAGEYVGVTRISLEVCVDHDGYIRRIRQISAYSGVLTRSTITLDVMEFGIPLPSDWSRIPHPSDGSPLS